MGPVALSWWWYWSYLVERILFIAFKPATLHCVVKNMLQFGTSLFDRCPPRTFLPALCRILTDDTAPENIVEVTSRAITFYLDVSSDCARRVVAHEGAVAALCTRLDMVDIGSRVSVDLAEQNVKVWMTILCYHLPCVDGLRILLSEQS